MIMTELIVLFYSTNHAMWASNVFKENNIECKMLPVPRQLSSDCGYCIKLDNNHQEICLELLKSNDIEFDRFELLP